MEGGGGRARVVRAAPFFSLNRFWAPARRGPLRAAALCPLSLTRTLTNSHAHRQKKKLTGAGLTAAVLAAGLIAFRQVCVCGER